jgi:hypothetical protein
MVCIDLDVFPIGSKKQVEDMIAIEPGHITPGIAIKSAALHLAVVIGIDAIDETA